MVCSSSSSGGTRQRRRSLADVIDWTINLPWQSMFAWAVVLGVASQLSDFFGVREGAGRDAGAATPNRVGGGGGALPAAPGPAPP